MRNEAAKAEIETEQFEFNGIPETVPGTTQDTINKLMPELREQGFNALAQA